MIKDNCDKHDDDNCDDDCYDNTSCNVFFYQGFLPQTLTIHRTAGEGRGPPFTPLYHSTNSTRSRTLRHLFATLHDACLLNELILGFCQSDCDMGSRWI